jgi:dipeptide/tripeptide permease
VNVVVAFVCSIVCILGAATAVQLGWLRDGRGKTVLVFLAGAAAFFSLWIVGVPPDWFSGRKTGWIMTVSMLAASAIATGTSQERTFRRPLFLGIGLMLLVANALQAVRNVL